MAADAHQATRQPLLCELGEVDDLGNVREIIAGERDCIGPPIPEPAFEVAMALDLQVDEPHLVAGSARRLRHQLEPKRLQAQKDLGVHERARMDREKLH